MRPSHEDLLEAALDADGTFRVISKSIRHAATALGQVFSQRRIDFGVSP